MKPSKTAARRLRRVRQLLARPYGWTRGTEQRSVRSRSGEHVRAYCLTGAVRAVSGTLRSSDIRYLNEAIFGSDEHFINALQRWNDNPHRKKVEVLAACDRAIQLAAGDADS